MKQRSNSADTERSAAERRLRAFSQFNAKLGEAAFAQLPIINGYPETFSVFPGDVVAIRAARKPGSDPEDPSPTNPRSALIGRYKVQNAVTKQVILDEAPAAAIRILEQAPKDYRGDGAAYECCLSLDTAGWPPGVYECVIVDDSGDKSQEIYFNIKPRSFEKYDLVCILPTFTWQAYNAAGGGSFYSARKKGPDTTVSLHRPIPRRIPDSMTMALPGLAAFEAAKINYCCIDSWDLHHGLCRLSEAPVVALLTHDEYWSAAMRNEVDRFLEQRGVLLVVAGNVCWWQIDVNGTNITVNKKRGRRIGRWHVQKPSEETTFGASFRFGGYPVQRVIRSRPTLARHTVHLSEREIQDSGGIRVLEPDHPIFRGMTLKEDNSFGSDVPIMNGEIDGVPLAGDGTVDRTLYTENIEPHILATGLAVRDVSGVGVHRVGVVIEASIKGGHVVHFGTFGWSRGLRAKNKAVEQIVLNAYRYCRSLARQGSRS